MTFGIGRVQDVDLAAEALAELEAAEIVAKQSHTHEEQCLADAFCTENSQNAGHGYVPCGASISRRVFFSNTMGCRVLCEQHWISYFARHGLGETFEAIMDGYRERSRVEARRVKRCAVCASANAHWNSSAGRDLCPRHWDEY